MKTTAFLAFFLITAAHAGEPPVYIMAYDGMPQRVTVTGRAYDIKIRASSVEEACQTLAEVARRKFCNGVLYPRPVIGKHGTELTVNLVRFKDPRELYRSDIPFLVY